MFVEVVRLTREMGVVRFGTLSVDGTKVRANCGSCHLLFDSRTRTFVAIGLSQD